MVNNIRKVQSRNFFRPLQPNFHKSKNHFNGGNDGTKQMKPIVVDEYSN